MRMEELSDGRYIKSTDSVERYLLDIVQNYFKNQTAASSTSKEAIINRAVARMKDEIDFESIGVLSIELPDGQKRIGAVQISLQDLGGEPAIQNKKTAFNVDFGDKPGTACEGNDPRLSDSRKPVSHQHSISDIENLNAVLLALQGKTNRLAVHDHENLNVLDIIRYTGTKPSIDLIDIEKLQSSLNTLLADAQSISDTCKKDTLSVINNIQNDIQTVQQNFSQLQTGIDNQGSQYREQLETEMNNVLSEMYSNIDEKFDNYATSSEMANLKQAISSAIVGYNTTAIYMTDVMAAGGKYKVNDGIPVEIQSISAKSEPIIDSYIVINGAKTKLPYFIFDDDLSTLKGTVSVEYDGRDVYIVCNAKSPLSADLLSSSIQIVYSVKGV